MKTLAVDIRSGTAQVRKPVWKDTVQPPQFDHKQKFLHNLAMIGVNLIFHDFFQKTFQDIFVTLKNG